MILDRTVENPMYQHFLKLQSNYQSLDYVIQRGLLLRSTSFTLDHPDTIQFLVENLRELGIEKIVDPLAGTGYWANILCNHGFNVIATDLYNPKQNTYHYLSQPWYEIEYGINASDSIKQYQDRVLLLSWPPYDDSIAYEILRVYQNNVFVYMGEPPRTLSGDQQFWDLIELNWKVVRHKQVFPYHPKSEVEVTIYLRK